MNKVLVLRLLLSLIVILIIKKKSAKIVQVLYFACMTESKTFEKAICHNLNMLFYLIYFMI